MRWGGIMPNSWHISDRTQDVKLTLAANILPAAVRGI